MKRKLASIQIIKSLTSIEGADKLMKAIVLGWELVVLKNEFGVGDKCVYCEVDSILPDKPEFEFLRERKFRIRTIKLRGQVSQGICFPLSVLPKGDYNEGDDVTELLGVRKHDPQAEAEQKELDRLNTIHKNRLKKYFMRFSWFRRLVFRPQRLARPGFVRKTDEDRIQLFPNICETQKGTKFHATEKLDGTSASFFVVRHRGRYKYGICSRNFQVLKKVYPYWDVSEKFNIKKILIELAKKEKTDVIVQGEIIGPKVQGNKYGFEELGFFIFNLKIGHDWYWYPEEIFEKLTQFVSGEDGMMHIVPLLRTEYILPDTIPEAVETAKGQSLLADIPREGIVIRCEGLSLKIVNPDFLLEYGE